MTDTFSINPPDRLFTWVDVDEHFRSLAMRRRWPGWLREVSAYWDGVEFTVLAGTDQGEIWAWLRSVLGRLSIDTERAVILLESPDQERVLPVVFVCVDADDPTSARRRPEWNETLLTSDLGRPLPSPTARRFADEITVGAFHSFKGGVGRTLHCVALAHLVATRSRERVLLIDADMEAPGVSWMMRSQGFRGEFSFADFLALVHGSIEGDSAEAVKIARPYLVNQEMDGVFVLPAQRDPEKFGPPRIEPRHLLSPGRSPYFLTESLADLAHELGARTVLIDLRAGMSETSAPVLLDPRVKRVFVTTVSDQSVRGTVRLLNELALRAPSLRESDPVPTALITQFDDRDHEELVESVSNDLGDAIAGIISPGAGGEDSADRGTGELSRLLISAPLRSPFNSALLALPAAWGAVRTALDRAETLDVLEELADELTPPHEDSAEGRLSAYEAEKWQRDRGRLAEFADRMRSPESGDVGGDLLRTDALVHLATAHRTDLPIEIITGAKGSGKTFTYLMLCRNRRWQDFVKEVRGAGAELDAPIVPVLAPRDLAGKAKETVDTAGSAAARELGGARPDTTPHDLITEALSRQHTDMEWRQIWLTCFARAAGRTSYPHMAEEVLAGLAAKSRAVFVLDGLEDLFPEPHQDTRQQQALRVLLTDCQEWLRALRGRPLGLIVYIRRDLAQRALPGDSGRILAEYRNHALRWERTEALRLVAWAADRAKALPFPRDKKVLSATENELSEHLTSMWGEQMGARGAKEARSQEWFLTALSDFTNQIQPRDVFRFLAEAARLSAAEPGEWKRLLAPSAMHEALLACSRAKTEAMAREIPAVGAVFERFAGVDEDRRTVPFDSEAIPLNLDEFEILTANGIIAQVKGEYWMPEIYRRALGFTAKRRPPLLSIAKEARRRSAGL
ncbi:MinD-like ATPase involved in chromosome partitioning or flagellar assembly [Spinactinospora alkalitolerans]|uniref:MinD-like ATPase involved in chromosome partitioning or flagellar assembly n=1 Tax=Spinactinospora alkalitolerans TaxID=687207 RepID=A0A852TR09_9ACTN|nr:hypothetical protein [Spinactinospora alkalitolerans]NYE46005.1 MinD-like ATPase involved in chromosome partitioning or flagellar assembly [Spinactinospora alkalitolerans]